MKLIIFSDSHTYLKNLLFVTKKESPDLIIHLGDVASDMDKVHTHYPLIPIFRVRGNCDAYSSEPASTDVEISGLRFFLTHGHNYQVKTSLDIVKNAARTKHFDFVLFGHTHIPYYEKTAEGLTLLNPGCIGNCKSPSFARIIIRDDYTDAQIVRI